jgi:hypothetical protein
MPNPGQSPKTRDRDKSPPSVRHGTWPVDRLPATSPADLMLRFMQPGIFLITATKEKLTNQATVRVSEK